METPRDDRDKTRDNRNRIIGKRAGVPTPVAIVFGSSGVRVRGVSKFKTKGTIGGGYPHTPFRVKVTHAGGYIPRSKT